MGILPRVRGGRLHVLAIVEDASEARNGPRAIVRADVQGVAHDRPSPCGPQFVEAAFCDGAGGLSEFPRNIGPRVVRVERGDAVRVPVL
jgi:hypothetical protein